MFGDSLYADCSQKNSDCMKQLAELIPLILFFIAYQMKGTTVTIGEWSHTLDGIFSATAVLIIATAVQVLLTWVFTRELEKRLLWLLAAVCVFGGATLLFRDQTFIFWKPTVFNWVLALVFGASNFIGDRNLMERTLGHQLELPKPVRSILGELQALFGLRLHAATHADHGADHHALSPGGCRGRAPRQRARG